jgi:hypothetical protein
LEIDDTTAYADLGDKIVESIKATIGGTEETISTFQILAATASKAGLLSAADKAKLDALWSSGYQFVGIATPSTTPVNTTSKIFYVATEAGTYFNAVTVTRGINILSWDGTSWSAVQVIGIDDKPTPNSSNLVESGGVSKYVNQGTLTRDNTQTTFLKFKGVSNSVYSIKFNRTDWATSYTGGDTILGIFIKYIGITNEVRVITVNAGETPYNEYKIATDSNPVEYIRLSLRITEDVEVGYSISDVKDIKGTDEFPVYDSDKWVSSTGLAQVIYQGVLTYTSPYGIMSLRVKAIPNSTYAIKFARTDWATSYTGQGSILGVFIKYAGVEDEVRVVNVQAGTLPDKVYNISTDNAQVEYIRLSIRNADNLESIGYSITDITTSMQFASKGNIVRCALQYGGIGSTANDGKLNPVNTISSTDFHLRRHAMRTPHYIDVRYRNSLNIKLDKIGNIKTVNVVGYNSTFNRIESSYRTYTVSTDWTEGNWFTIDVKGYDYIRFILLPPSGETLHMCDMFVKDVSHDDFIKEIRRGTGYVGLSIPVNVVNPNSCDDTTNNVQDSEDIYVDYGVLALPPSYTNIGKKTRMIIYCHGAAVNYATNTSSFNSIDIDPTYWLSEGYAIMDMEGNPFNNEDEHFGIPQAAQCYVNAYKWILETYNIEDAVFVGGRSMGGLMAVELLRTEIPVIACCPNVMAINPVWNWNYMNAARRGFCATRMGFLNQPIWTSASPLPSDQLQSLSDNFDKLVSCSTMWALICDLPSKSILLSVNVGRNVAESPEEEAIYANLHALVKCPVKIFSNEEDDIVMPKRNAHLFYRVLKNAGQIVEMRKFFVSGTGISAHHYELSTPLQTTITNTFGENITTSVVYIEMLQFWRRYEKMSN